MEDFKKSQENDKIQQADIDLNWAWLPFAAAMLPESPMLYWSPAFYDSPTSSIRRAYARLAKSSRGLQLPAEVHGHPQISAPTLLNSSRINIFTEELPENSGTSTELKDNGAKLDFYRGMSSSLDKSLPPEECTVISLTENSCSAPTESFLYANNYENLKISSLSSSAAQNETFETIDLNENDDAAVKVHSMKEYSVSRRSDVADGSSIPDESSIYGANYSLSFISRSSSNIRRKRVLIAIVVTAIAMAVAVIILTAWLAH